MSPLRRIILAVVVGSVAVAVAAGLVALTDSPPERAFRRALGIGCVPERVASPGWRSERPLSAELDEPKAVALGGQIYLAGGIDDLVSFGNPSDVPGVKETTEVRTLDQFRRFDPDTGRYTTLAKLPEPRNHFGMTARGTDIYVVGGEADIVGGAYTKSDFFRYETTSDEWSRMPSMPSRRSAVAAGIVGDRLYVAGGLDRGQALRTLEIFDFQTDRWSRGPDMPSAREHVGAAVLDGQFYVLGGRDRRTDALRTVERFDPGAGRWEVLRPLPTPSGGLGSAAVDGQVLAVGGGNDREGTVTGALASFDPRQESWEVLPSMKTKRHGLAAAVAGGRLYTFGGSPCAYFAASDFVESFDLSESRSR